MFNIDNDKKSIGALHSQGGTDYKMEKLPPFDPSLEELKVYEGKYFCEELETFYTIVVKDSAMYAMHKNLKDIKFSPAEDDTFSGDIYFMREAAFKRNTEGQVNAFYVSNGRTKGVLFNKQ